MLLKDGAKMSKSKEMLLTPRNMVDAFRMMHFVRIFYF